MSNLNQNPEKQKALAAALAQIEKNFGKGSIMKFDADSVEEIPVYRTGSLSLDAALGVGGIPRGRIIEIYGPESSGKTTLTLQVVADAQKQGGTCAFIDAEHALDTSYAQKLGVNLDELLISQPDTGEQALEIVDTLVSSGAVDLIIIDSVAALVPKAEIEGEMGDSHMGLQARLMSQALRKLTANAKRMNCTLVFINQLRMKIGVMFGNPETTTGGNALKFYASIRLDIRKIGQLKDGDEAIGAAIILRAIKAPLKQIVTNAGYDAGVVANEVEKSTNENLGFNAATGEYVDMFEAGIVDPAKVERVAMQNAVSVASLLLTTEATVTEIKEDKAPAMPDMSGMGGMPGMM